MPADIGPSHARTRGDVGKAGLIGPIGDTAFEHEAPVAIAAIDIAVLVNLQPHARMTKRGGAMSPAPSQRTRAVAVKVISGGLIMARH